MSLEGPVRAAARASSNRVGLGCWQLGGDWGEISPRECRDIVVAAVDGGANIFDTALEYGQGQSEKVIAEVVDFNDPKNIVITKVPPKNDHWSPGISSDWREYFPDDWVYDCVHRSLRNLGGSCVPVVLLHTWCETWDVRALAALNDIKAAGLVSAIGVSTPDFSSASALRVASLLDVVELTFSVTEQSPIECLSRYQAACVDIVARCPFSSGALATLWTEERPFTDDDWRSRWVDDAWRRRQVEMSALFSSVCQRYGIVEARAALEFVLAVDEVTCVVAGARTPEQARANSSVGRSDRLHLNQSMFKELRELWHRGAFSPVFNGAA